MCNRNLGFMTMDMFERHEPQRCSKCNEYPTAYSATCCNVLYIDKYCGCNPLPHKCKKCGKILKIQLSKQDDSKIVNNLRILR